MPNRKWIESQGFSNDSYWRVWLGFCVKEGGISESLFFINNEKCKDTKHIITKKNSIEESNP